jgi:hypothetical protein
LRILSCNSVNTIGDLSAYAIEHALDGFVLDGRIHTRTASEHYQAYLAAKNSRQRRESDRKVRTWLAR